MKALVDGVQDLVGNTPLVRLKTVAPTPHRFFAKCEFLNPGGSIKDRIGLAMVLSAEASGALRPGGTIVEATAGNTGVGLALAAQQRGYSLVTTVTTKASSEKVAVLRAYGASVVVCPYEAPSGSPQHFITVAREIAAQTSGGWFADQFNNRANFSAHYERTGPEIWRQTSGRVDVIIAGAGTGGSLCGIAAYLKEQNQAVRAVMVDPVGSILAARWRDPKSCATAQPYSIEGIGGDFIPGLLDMNLIDDALQVSDAEAVAAARLTARREGLLVGFSSGAIVAGAIAYASRIPDGKNIVLLLPDGGRSYLSTVYNDDWHAHDRVVADARILPSYEEA